MWFKAILFLLRSVEYLQARACDRLANLADARGGSIQAQGKEPITSADLRKAAQLHRGWAKARRT